MDLRSARFFSPSGLSLEEALRSARIIGVGAHQDDLEFMCFHAILAGYDNEHFFGVIATDGRGSARSGQFKKVKERDFIRIRAREQERAARIGRYAGVLQLGCQSAEISKSFSKELLSDLNAIFSRGRFAAVYTHNLADKHPSHVGVAAHVIRSLRTLPRKSQPAKLYGCEVWRGLDWLPEHLKVPHDVSGRKSLAWKLMTVFKSQLDGKDYANAVLGRRRANATFLDSHSLDDPELVEYCMDMSELLAKPSLTMEAFMRRLLKAFEGELLRPLKSLDRKKSRRVRR